MLSKNILCSVLVTLATGAMAIMPLVVDQNRFIKPSYSEKDEGEVFFIKGVDYQPGGSSDYSDSDDSDVLTDSDACLRDAYAFQQLGANTIRIYTINPALDHDECMSIFNAAGIYVFIDVNSPLSNESLDRSSPDTSYNYWYLERVFKVIDAFKNYPNIAGFVSGNEVINDAASAESCPPYLRAVQRDMKRYIANNANRTIPVGYSAADVTTLRAATWEYFQCNIDDDDDDESKSDFFGLNSYEWCSGVSTWSSSGYSSINSTFSDASIPVFFSEYGCNTESPRTFDEVDDGVFSGLIDTLSGGLVYEYSEETSDYGLVDIDDDDSIEYLDDFTNLKGQFANATIPEISEADVATVDLVKCDSTSIKKKYSNFGANFTLPDAPDGVEDLILYGVNNSNIGEIIDVTSKQSNYSVKDTDGNKISNHSITFVDNYQISTIGGDETATSVASTTTSKSSSSSKGVAAAASVNYGGSFAALGLAVLAFL